jgi:peptidoglycan hydrolase CwlO-like protein
MKNEKNEKKSSALVSFRRNNGRLLVLFQDYGWILTVLLFLLVFIFSLLVWYQSILNVQPSQRVVSDFQLKQKEIENKIQSIEKTIEKMQERQLRFEAMPQTESLRDIFKNEDLLLEQSKTIQDSQPIQ